MRLGCFGHACQIQQIEEAGFDAAELDICELVAMSDAEFQAFCNTAKNTNLSFEIFSGLFPLSMRIYEEDFDETYWLSHVRLGASRAEKLGAKMIPFGAGKCRSIPEGCADPEACKKKLRNFVESVCQVLKPYDITLIIEPLGPANSNYLNTLEEVGKFIREINMDNCKMMCDLRHMVKNRETLDELWKYKKDIRHAHIDYPKGTERLFPQKCDDYDYGPYIQSLCGMKYEGIVTIEATAYQDFQIEAKASGTYLKQLILKCEKET